MWTVTNKTDALEILPLAAMKTELRLEGTTSHDGLLTTQIRAAVAAAEKVADCALYHRAEQTHLLINTVAGYHFNARNVLAISRVVCGEEEVLASDAPDSLNCFTEGDGVTLIPASETLTDFIAANSPGECAVEFRRRTYEAADTGLYSAIVVYTRMLYNGGMKATDIDAVERLFAPYKRIG